MLETDWHGEGASTLGVMKVTEDPSNPTREMFSSE